MTKKIPTASDDVWDAYLQVYRMINARHKLKVNTRLILWLKCIAFSTLPLFDELDALFENNAATGSGAIASTQISSGPGLSVGEEDDYSSISDIELEGDRNFEANGNQDTPDPKRSNLSKRFATPSPAHDNKRSRIGESPSGSQFTGRNRQTVASKIAEAIKNLSERPPAMTVHERAICTLTESFSNLLSERQMVAAYSLVVDKAKATVFVTMPPGRCRELWLLAL